MNLIGTDISDGSRASLRVAIPNTYTHLKIIYQGRSTSPSYVDVAAGLQFNDDTGTTYWWQQARFNSNSAQITRGGGGTEVRIGISTVPAGLAEAGSSGTGEILVPNYKSTHFYKHANVLASEHWAYPEGNDAVMVNCGIRRDIGEIVSVSLVLDEGVWTQYSQIWAYGI